MGLGDIADLDRPAVRGATVRVALRDDPLWAILGAERIGDGRLTWPNREHSAFHFAGEKFRDDSAIAEGLRSTDRLLQIYGSEPGTPTQAMLDGQQRVRRAWLAVRGPENDAWVADAIRIVVLGRASLRLLERHQGGAKDGRHRNRVLLGLKRLVDFYGL